VITVDKNAAYPVAVDKLKQDKTFKAETELRQRKYLNNIIEQDNRNIKRIVGNVLDVWIYGRMGMRA
jgi:IS6 family transposase